MGQHTSIMRCIASSASFGKVYLYFTADREAPVSEFVRTGNDILADVLLTVPDTLDVLDMEFVET